MRISIFQIACVLATPTVAAMNDDYLAQRITKQHRQLNIDERKKKTTVHSVLSCTPAKLKSAFTERVSTAKKTAPSTSDSVATAGARSTRASVAASIPSTSNDELWNAMHPFSTAKKRGRKRKDIDDDAPPSAHATV